MAREIFGGPKDGRPNADAGRTPRKEPHRTPTDPRFICITSTALAWDLYYFLGDGQPTPTDGTGGWEVLERPKRTSATNWRGLVPWSIAIPLMIDNYTDDQGRVDTPRSGRRKHPPHHLEDIKKDRRRKRAVNRWRRHRDRQHPVDVEDYVKQLVHLARPIDRFGQPPVIRVYGRALPFWLNGEQWVINGIDWGDRLPGSVGGHARRQALTLNLLEYVEGDDYRFKRNKKGGKKGDGRKGGEKHYTVKKGDTLYSIAAKFYNDRDKWKRIAEANKIKNPRDLKVGDRLVIP